ncbi:MAG: N-6 DNA methylase [Blastocatellia bacterium]
MGTKDRRNPSDPIIDSTPMRRQAADRIIRLLERIPDGLSHMDKFRLFVEAGNQFMDNLPALFGRVVNKVPDPLQSPEDELVRWREAGLHQISKTCYDIFAQSIGILIDASQNPDGTYTYDDILGPVYMSVIGGSRWNSDQFYTPDAVARCMAQMSIHDADLDAEFRRRCRQAWEGDPILEALVLSAGLAAAAEEHGTGESEGAPSLFLTRVWPALRDRVEPFKINDPCCGSGVMFLAAASVIPRWLIDIGWVRFYGQDIQHIAVEMCRLNLKLYGITPLRIKPADCLTALELLNLPEPYQEAYSQLDGSPEGHIAALEVLSDAGLRQPSLWDEDPIPSNSMFEAIHQMTLWEDTAYV